MTSPHTPPSGVSPPFQPPGAPPPPPGPFPEHQPPVPPQPPPKSSKTPALVGALVVFSVLALCVGGFTVYALADDEPTSDASQSDDEAADDADDAPDDAEEAADDAAAEGSREDPMPVDEDFVLDDWTVQLTASDLDATDTVLAENMYNEIDGVAVMTTVAVVYTGDDAEDPWLNLQFAFVSESGLTYDYADSCGVIPDPDYEVGEMYTDAEATYNICADVPEDEVDGGLWTVELLFSLDDSVFVALE